MGGEECQRKCEAFFPVTVNHLCSPPVWLGGRSGLQRSRYNCVSYKVWAPSNWGKYILKYIPKVFPTVKFELEVYALLVSPELTGKMSHLTSNPSSNGGDGLSVKVGGGGIGNTASLGVNPYQETMQRSQRKPQDT